MRLGKPKPLLQRSGSKGAPSISPDNRWIAYASNESGHFEIYAMPFSPDRSNTPNKWLISSGGGTSPIWSRSRRELFYQGTDRRVHVVGYQVRGDLFVAEKPRVWSETLLAETGIFNAFDLAPDGNRAIGLFPAGESRDNTLVRVVLNVSSPFGRTMPSYGNQ